MSPRPLAFLDIETTGLNPDLHDVWEIALILREPDEEADAEFRWTVEPDLATADPKALEIGRYWERTMRLSNPRFDAEFYDSADAARELAHLLVGAVVVGANPAFDQAFLTRWLRRHGQVWAAHYRTIDVTTLGWGYLIATSAVRAAEGMPRSEAVSGLIGVDPAGYDRHTALGDARWVRDQFSVITAPQVGGAS